MKKLILILLLFFVSNVYSQIDIKPFEEFTGKWEGIYEAGGEKNKEILNNSLIHKNMFFRMDVSGEMVKNSSLKYSSSAIFTINDNDEIIGWGFSEDGYKGIVNYKGKIVDNKVILSGKCTDYTLDLSYEIKDSKLIRKSKYIFKDSPDNPSIVECVYTKK